MEYRFLYHEGIMYFQDLMANVLIIPKITVWSFNLCFAALKNISTRKFDHFLPAQEIARPVQEDDVILNMW